jgi:recombination protein RecA
VKIVKNKVSPPYRKVEMEIMFGKGISASGSLLDGAVQHKIIQKSGSWYSVGEERIGQGRENAKAFLEENADVYADVDRQLREILFPAPEGKETKQEKKKKSSKAEVTEEEGAAEEGLF